VLFTLGNRFKAAKRKKKRKEKKERKKEWKGHDGRFLKSIPAHN
jgi:hypothetical protein